MNNKKKIVAALLLAGIPLLQAAETEPVLVPTPRAKALAVTASSRPFLAALRSQQVVDLSARGYSEGEFLVRGFVGANQPFVTRMLVRRPQLAAKFSGRVIVELLDASTQYETAPLWGYSWEHFIRRGDVWVGVTVAPAALTSLRKFNAARYGSLNLVAGSGSCGITQEGFPADVLAQVGAMLRSSSKENPLLNLNPQRVIAAGYSGSGDSIATFAISSHRTLRLGDGSAVFDGFVNVGGTAAVPESCSTEGLPRVPFVTVMAGPLLGMLPVVLGSGEPTSTTRVYEIAGAEGAGRLAAGAPAVADMSTVGFAAGEARCREPIKDLIMSHAMNAVWQQLDDLLVQKLPMVAAEPFVPGRSGGWRMPQVILPLAGAVPGRRLVSTQSGANENARPVCDAVTGTLPRFDVATLKQLYRSRAEYLRRFNAAVDEAVTGRLLVKEDGDALKAAVLRTAPAF